MKTKKKVVRKPKVEAWRAELARIVRFLNNPSEDSVKLWHILTALRGPDSGLDSEKMASTCVIRHAVGINYGAGGCIVYPDSPNSPGTRSKLTGHFKEHVRWAFDDLGLKWDEVNKKEEV